MLTELFIVLVVEALAPALAAAAAACQRRLLFIHIQL